MLHKILIVLICFIWAIGQSSCGRKTVLQEVPYVPPPISAEETNTFPPPIEKETGPASDAAKTIPPDAPPLPTGNEIPPPVAEPTVGGELTAGAKPTLIEGYTRDQIRFRIQLGAFEKPKAEDDPFFTPISGEEVRVERASNGYYRYSVGWFDDLAKAEVLKKQLQDKGYKTAFIVAFGEDDKRINMDMKEVMRLYLGQ